MSAYFAQTVPVWWYYISTLVPIILFAVTLWRKAASDRLLDLYKESLTVARQRRDSWRAKAVEEKRLSVEIVERVLPLVEKTDWMTGRWGGQFSTLQALEYRRNAQVDAVRKAIMSLPSVNDLTVAEKLGALQGAGNAALNGLVSAPSGEVPKVDLTPYRPPQEPEEGAENWREIGDLVEEANRRVN